MVYPVGVTEFRLCFMSKITNNSLNVKFRFTSNLILVFAFRPLMHVPNFSQIGEGIHELAVAIFAKCAN